MYKSLLILTALTIMIVSCKKSKKTEETSDNTTTVEDIKYTAKDIKIMFDTTSVLLNSSWDSVVINDDSKMADIKRLLDEISYCDGADEKKLKELFAKYEEVKSMRYNQDNITGELIDNYDEAQTNLINSSIALAETTPNIEAHPIAIELMDEIIKADGMVFSKRGDYDVWAKQINKTLKDYPELVKELGTPYSNYKKLGIFGFEE